jgi:hypothetical protein
VRHSLSADYIWDLPFRFHKFAENEVLGRWSVAGKTFWRGGQPFTVYNSSIPNSINGTFITGYNGVNEVIADVAARDVLGRHRGSSGANFAAPWFASTDFDRLVGSGNVRFFQRVIISMSVAQLSPGAICLISTECPFRSGEVSTVQKPRSRLVLQFLRRESRIAPANSGWSASPKIRLTERHIHPFALHAIGGRCMKRSMEVFSLVDY